MGTKRNLSRAAPDGLTFDAITHGSSPGHGRCEIVFGFLCVPGLPDAIVINLQSAPHVRASVLARNQRTKPIGLSPQAAMSFADIDSPTIGR